MCDVRQEHIVECCARYRLYARGVRGVWQEHIVELGDTSQWTDTPQEKEKKEITSQVVTAHCYSGHSVYSGYRRRRSPRSSPADCIRRLSPADCTVPVDSAQRQ